MPLTCSHVCMCVCACTCGVHICVGTHTLLCRLWPPATVQHAREAAGLRVLSCSVSQPHHAPSWTMNCVTFEQTNVMCRGASQTSTGNSLPRTYILILAPESTDAQIDTEHAHIQPHTHTDIYTLSPAGRVGLFIVFPMYQRACWSSWLDLNRVQEPRDVKSLIQHVA